MLRHSTVGAFRSTLRGRLLTKDDAAYDGARRAFNAMVDRRPALIAQCPDANDVIACVTFAREHDLLVSVRGGGHSIAGSRLRTLPDDNIQPLASLDVLTARACSPLAT